MIEEKRQPNGHAYDQHLVGIQCEIGKNKGNGTYIGEHDQSIDQKGENPFRYPCHLLDDVHILRRFYLKIIHELCYFGQNYTLICAKPPLQSKIKTNG